jgi:hypothetical protein
MSCAELVCARWSAWTAGPVAAQPASNSREIKVVGNSR